MCMYRDPVRLPKVAASIVFCVLTRVLRVPLNCEGFRRSHGRPIADGRTVVARAAHCPRLPGWRP